MNEHEYEDNFECPHGFNKEKRILLLQRIVDGQASKEEQKYFYRSIERCEKCECKNICETHIEIKNLLKAKLKEKNLPFGLIDEIKERIKATD